MMAGYEIAVDYIFTVEGHHQTGAGRDRRLTTNPSARAIAALLGDIEGVLKNRHGEDCWLVWWTVRALKTAEPTQEGRL
jgi:hypothetical protein